MDGCRGGGYWLKAISYLWVLIQFGSSENRPSLMNGWNISCLFGFEIENLSPPKSLGPTHWTFYRLGLFYCAGPQDLLLKFQ